MPDNLHLDREAARHLEEKYDPEMHFRTISPPTTFLVEGALVVLSCFHYYTAGFGLLRETTHRGFHMALVLGLIFLVFGWRKKSHTVTRRSTFFLSGRIAALRLDYGPAQPWGRPLRAIRIR